MADDWGLKVTQLGFDVNVASDQNLLFSSGWPVLKIDTPKDGVTAAGGGAIYSHGLGYPPFYLVFKRYGDKFYLYNNPSFYVDSENFGFSGDGTVHDIRFFICRNPLNENFTATIGETGVQVQGEVDHDWGFKATLPGKDITSTDLRDYSVHSSTRGPMIHKVQYGQLESTGSFYEINYTNNLGYVPIFFGFHSNDGETFNGLVGLEQSPPKLFVDPDGNIKIQSLTATYGTIFVFKDPFLVTDVEEVSI